MSEITTGSVEVSSIRSTTQKSVQVCGRLVLNALKKCGQSYQKMLDDIEKVDQRLKWLDQQQISSPVQIAEEAMNLRLDVLNNETFQERTKGIDDHMKSIIAGAIATENSPLNGVMPSFWDAMETSTNTVEEAIKTGAKELALSNFDHVNNVVQEAAKATGFTMKATILKQTSSIMDVVFTDSKSRNFTAFARLNNQMNSILALDLEGFECDSNECSVKMNEIIRYLNEHGIPFKPKRSLHRRPEGILRKAAQKSHKERSQDMENYLHGNKALSHSNNIHNKSGT